MSLSVALNNALTGLQASESVIQVISNNVTNANTEGYTRKTVDQISVTLDAEGRGADTTGIKRVVDERLLSDLRRNLAGLGASRIKDFYYQRVIDQFGTLANNSSLGAGLSDLANALEGMAASPESAANRIDVITNAVDLAKQISDMSAQVQNLRFDADKDITSAVDDLNGELQNFAELNRKIEAAKALGDPTGELEDFRDKSLDKISEVIDVRYFRRTSGEVVLTLPDGKVLADTNAKTLSHTPAAALSADITLASGGIAPILLGTTDVTNVLGAGKLSGLVEVRDKILPDLQSELDLLTQKLRDELNLIHNAGAGLPPANTLTGTRTFAAPSTDTVTLSAAVRIAVVDETGKFASSFDLAAGTYAIDQIESAIDTNLVGFATASTSVNGPLSISATNAKNGIAIVDIGTQSVTHTDGKTKYSGFSNYFGLNDFFVTPTLVQGDSTVGLANRLQVRADLISDPARLSRGKLSAVTTPAPIAGDVAISLGDSSSAQALADKFVEKLSFGAVGGLPPTTTTLSGFASDILSANAVAASVAEGDVSFRETLSQEQSFRAQQVSGVNVDEELRNMVLFENAYSASARVFQTVDDLLDIRINLGR